jgi:hypothetical protein
VIVMVSVTSSPSAVVPLHRYVAPDSTVMSSSQDRSIATPSRCSNCWETSRAVAAGSSFWELSRSGIRIAAATTTTPSTTRPTMRPVFDFVGWP